MQLRTSNERGYFENSWLKSFHSFSFADYYDPKHMHFRDLRVINHDFIAPQAGFPTHPHRDMEIMTYVLKGRVAHQDSMGNKAFVNAGEIQVMSAGTGVAHSEFNPDASELELLQIWIVPEVGGLKPSYFQKSFVEERKNKMALLVSPKGEQGSLTIHQDVKVYGSLLDEGRTLEFQVPEGRHVWLQLAGGQLEINGQTLNKGDGIAYDSADQRSLKIKSQAPATDFVLFDLN